MLKVLKVRRFVIVFLVSIMCLLIAPFHVYADTISSSNIVGVNVSVVDYEVVGDNVFNTDYPKTSFIIKFELVLDKEYLGYLTGKFTCSIFGHDSQGQQLQINVDSGNKSFYVCGQTLTYYVEQKLYFSNTPTSTYVNIYTPSFTLAGSNVVEFGLLETLEDIQRAIEMLDFHTEQITQYLYDSTNGTILEQVVTTNQLLVDAGQMFYNVMLTTDNINDYVMRIYDLMEKFAYYDIPYESFPYIYYQYSLNNRIIRYDNIYSYVMPIFISNNSSRVFYSRSTNTNINYFYIVYLIEETQQLIYPSGFSLINRKTIGHYRIDVDNLAKSFYMYVDKVGKANNNSFFIPTVNSNVYFCPIYLGDGENVSDNFAQQFGLIDKTSQEALDDGTEDMQTQFNDMFDYEDDFNSDMNNALQNINVNFDVGNQLGSKFLASADWVRQQYNTLTSNTPFGTVLSFSLLLGLALLIIGKAVR